MTLAPLPTVAARLLAAGLALLLPAGLALASPDCARLEGSRDPAEAARGHECRAREALRAGRLDEALAQLDRAIALAPRRAEPHLARLAVLLETGRLDEVLPSLERALAAAPDAEAADWLGVPAELFSRGFAAESLAASKLLEKRWKRDPSVLGSIGAALAVLERDEEALIYLRAAAEAAPSDPVHRWNLARLLAYAGRNEEAAAEFAAWSALETDRERLVRQSCVFAAFVERQLGDRPRACRLQQEFCPEPERSACAPLPASPESPP